MQHNTTRIPTFQAILRLERFTTLELCEETGLERGQVGPLLAELKKKGVLETGPAETGAPQPAHRPILQYRLTDDTEKRTVLVEQVQAFLQKAVRGYKREDSKRYYLDADQKLDEIDFKLDFWELSPWQKPDQRSLDLCQEALDATSDTLELATLEAGLSLSQVSEILESPEEENPPVVRAWDRWKVYSRRLKEIRLAIEVVDQQKRLEQEASAVWVNLAAHFTDRSGLMQRIEEQLKFAGKSIRPQLVFLKHELPHMHGCWEDSRVVMFLANAALQQTVGEAALKCLEQAWQVHPQPSLNLSLSGVCEVLGRPEMARKKWLEWLKRSQFLIAGGHIVIAQVSALEINAESYRALNNLSLKKGILCSLFSQRPIAGLGGVMRLLEPAFYDLLNREQWIYPSESIRSRLVPVYASGFVHERATCPGTSLDRLRYGLVRGGISPEEAWSTANAMDPNKTYIALAGHSSNRKVFELECREALSPLSGAEFITLNAA